MLGLERAVGALINVTNRGHDDHAASTVFTSSFQPAMHVLVLGATGGVGM